MVNIKLSNGTEMEISFIEHRRALAEAIVPIIFEDKLENLSSELFVIKKFLLECSSQTYDSVVDDFKDAFQEVLDEKYEN